MATTSCSLPAAACSTHSTPSVREGTKLGWLGGRQTQPPLAAAESQLIN